MIDHAPADFLQFDSEGSLAPARPTSDTNSLVQAFYAVGAIMAAVWESDSIYPVEHDEEALGVDTTDSGDGFDEGATEKYPMIDGHFECDIPESVLADVKALSASRGLDLTDHDIETIIRWGASQADSMDYWVEYPPVEVFDRLEKIEEQNPDITTEELVVLAMGMVAVPSGLHEKAARFFEETLKQAAVVKAEYQKLMKEYEDIREATRRQFRRPVGNVNGVSND